MQILDKANQAKIIKRVAETTRECPKCLQEKPLTEAYWRHDHSRKNGFQSRCKVCISATYKLAYRNYSDRKFRRQGNVGFHCPLWSLHCGVCNDVAKCWIVAKLSPESNKYPEQLKNRDGDSTSTEE